MRILLFICLFLGLAFCGPATAALNFYVTLEANGTAIDGEPTRNTMGEDEVTDLIEGYSFDHQVTSVEGRVTHGEIRIIKRVDKASPLLHQALDQGFGILAHFWFYQPNGSGGTERFQTWTLTNGQITSISPWSTTGVGGGVRDDPFLEAITIKYQRLEIVSNTGATEYRYDVDVRQSEN